MSIVQQVLTHDDLLFYWMSGMSDMMMVTFSHVCVKSNRMMKRLYKANQHTYNVLHECIITKNINLLTYYLQLSYSLMEQDVLLIINQSDFKLFELIEKYRVIDYSTNMVHEAVRSNNVKMFKFISNKLYNNFIDYTVSIHTLAIVDNPEIFELCRDRYKFHDLEILIAYHSYNIIEDIRYRSTDRRAYENAMINLAHRDGNQEMIDYFIDEDYGNH
jgi:hypothetical protein